MQYPIGNRRKIHVDSVVPIGKRRKTHVESLVDVLPLEIMSMILSWAWTGFGVLENVCSIWRDLIFRMPFLDGVGPKGLTKIDTEKLFGFILLKGVQWKSIISFDVRTPDLSPEYTLLTTESRVGFLRSDNGWGITCKNARTMESLSIETEELEEGYPFARNIPLFDSLNAFLASYRRNQKGEPCVHLTYRQSTQAFLNKYCMVMTYEEIIDLWRRWEPNYPTDIEEDLWVPLTLLEWNCIHKKKYRAFMMSWLYDVFLANHMFFLNWINMARKEGIKFCHDQ